MSLKQFFHLFPYSEIPKDCKIVIYGMGDVGKDYIHQILESGYCKIRYGIDRNPGLNSLDGIKVYLPDEIKNEEEVDYFVIASDKENYINEIRKVLVQKEIPNEKIVCQPRKVYLNVYQQDLLKLMETFLKKRDFCREKHPLIIIGDSHVSLFGGYDQISFLPLMFPECGYINYIDNGVYPQYFSIHLGPVLAYHANMNNSSTRGREKVDFLCEQFIPHNSRLMFSYGEIDLRVWVLKQAEIRKCTYKEVIDDILEHYLEFLLEMQSRGYDVSVWGPIATQKDDAMYDESFPRYGAEQERNHATEYFNQQLQCQCEQHGIGFFSIFNKLIDSDYRSKQEYYLGDGVHLNQKAMTLAKECLEDILQ